MDTTLVSLTKRSVLTTAHELVQFIQEVAVDPYDDVDCRNEPRYPLAIPVQARTVDHNGKLTGTAVAGVTRDVSLAGISILLVGPTRAENLLLELNGSGRKSVHALLEVLRERQLGPFWEIAGRFLFDAQ